MGQGFPGGRQYQAFLSYARADDPEFREAVIAGLAAAGCRVWFDREAMPNRGTSFGQEIRRAIEASDRVILVAGPAALNSEYVAQEWGYAEDTGTPVVPVVRAIEFGALPEQLRRFHGIDGGRESVDVVVAELVRLLSEPPQPLGRLLGLPPHPPHAVARALLTERLSRELLLDDGRPQETAKAARVAVLFGVSGVGKSMVAREFAAAIRTRRVFADGIVWLAGGPDLRALTAAQELLRAVAPGAQLPDTVDEIGAALTAALAGRELLVVLDDVRDPDAASPFVEALTASTRLLITALDPAVATAFDAVQIPVAPLDDGAARAMLTGWTGTELPPEAEPVLAACDGLPFALAVVGAMVVNRTSWQAIASALDSRRLDLLANRFPGYPHRSVLGVLAAAFEALTADDPRAAECYLELGAYRPGATLTRSVLVRLWSRPGRLSVLEAELVVPVLERRLLLQPGAGQDRYTVHNLHEEFVRRRHPDPAGLSRALISTYRTDKGTGEWAALTDDGYVFDHLIDHLADLDDRATLFEVLTRAWIQAQWLRRGDLGQAVGDVHVTIEIAARAPIDLTAITRVGVLSGQLASTLRTVSVPMIGALAVTGDIDRALRWAAGQPDPPRRFAALTAVASIALEQGSVTMAERVCRVAAELIPFLGGTVESGFLAGLTSLNAVHALVHFPLPDEWEGTTDELVEMARVPLDALIAMAPMAFEARAVDALVGVTHPIWEPYGHLIPLVAVEELAVHGYHEAAAALLRCYPTLEGDEQDDRLVAAEYRRCVATAAVGDFETARAMCVALPETYQPVGWRGLARNLARAGRFEESFDALGLITDTTVADEAMADVLEAALARGVPEECRRTAVLAHSHGWADAAELLQAAAGDSAAAQRMVQLENSLLAMQLGTRLIDTYRQQGADDAAVEIVRALIGVAEQVLGSQWWAPETIGAPAEPAAAATRLAALLVRTGEPLPHGFADIVLGVENFWGGTPAFKLAFITELAGSGRFGEAIELASAGFQASSRALCLAGALAALENLSSTSESIDAVRQAMLDLTDALDHVDGDPVLDSLLADVVSVHRENEALGALTARLAARVDLPEALGAWSLVLAADGHTQRVHALTRRFLIDRELEAPPARARVMVLAALAGRRPGPTPELQSAAEQLAEVRVSAMALDIVADVIDQYGRQSLDTAAELARTIPSGQAGELAETMRQSKTLRWQIEEISEHDVARGGAVRTVSAAAMVLVATADGRRRIAKRWLRIAEDYLSGTHGHFPDVGVTEATAKYLWTARAALDPTVLPDDPALAAAVAWRLWDKGHRGVAARYADAALTSVRAAWQLAHTETPVLIFAEDYLRDSDIHTAVEATLQAVLMMSAAAEDDRRRANDLADGIDLASLRGMPSLTLAERAEYLAAIAIGMHRAGAEDTAAELLALAVEPAVRLARRGELAPFDRLCQAALEVLPCESAISLWAQWLRAAAQSASHDALALVASFVKWCPETALLGVTVDTGTGDLVRRSVPAADRMP